MEIIFGILGSFVMMDVIPTLCEGIAVFISYLRDKIKGFIYG